MNAAQRSLVPLCAALIILGFGVWFETTRVGDDDVTGSIDRLRPISFADLPGWAGDDHAAAWRAFLRSCQKDSSKRDRKSELCARALALGDAKSAQAREFFERHFTPHTFSGARAGFLTGYFEPELKGSRVRTPEYAVPIYAKPDDLLLRSPDNLRAKFNDQVTGFRRTNAGELPYWTREEIEKGALHGRGLELLYLADPVDAFILHVQGSGRVALTQGGTVRLGFAAKNGHPYTSIGKLLVERGKMAKEDMSLDSLKAWLAADRSRGRALMWENRSFIFFRELSGGESQAGPIGAEGVPLTPGRSIAVDASVNKLGLPIWVVSDTLDVHGARGFRRLMVAQDVGSAIRGAQRGDIFWGSGNEAGRAAGLTRHEGRFYVLLPKDGLASW